MFSYFHLKLRAAFAKLVSLNLLFTQINLMHLIPQFMGRQYLLLMGHLLHQMHSFSAGTSRLLVLLIKHSFGREVTILPYYPCLQKESFQ